MDVLVVDDSKVMRDMVVACLRAGVEELARATRDVDTATAEQLKAVESLNQTNGRLTQEGRTIAGAAAEQTRSTQALAQAAAEMRKMTRQTTQATSEHARALRDVVKINSNVSAACSSWEISETSPWIPWSTSSAGSRALVERGGRVITESETTTVVYGMPRAVAEAGLADVSGPLEELPALILSRL
jgi:CheY-like chemotaxis protein